MAVAGEGVANAQFIHHGKADAVGERPLLVGVLAEESARGVKPLWIEPFRILTTAADSPNASHLGINLRAFFHEFL